MVLTAVGYCLRDTEREREREQQAAKSASPQKAPTNTDSIMSSSEEEEFDEGEEEEAFEQEEEESSDDEPLSNLKATPDTPETERKRSASKPAASYKDESSEEEDDDDESSSDDDIPLSALAKKPAAKKTNGNSKKKPAAAKKDPPKKKKAPATKKAPPKKKSSTVSSAGSSKNYEWASAALYGSECDKGMLIQRLLCRWWYAYTWPDPTSLPVKPPKNYDSLDGFPGVYICTAGEDVGTIQDMRNKNEAPSFQNFAKKTAEDLRDLLVTAIEEQTKQLIASEGAGTPTEKELNDLLKWAKKLNASKAEKEAAKVLKAQGLSLSS